MGFDEYSSFSAYKGLQKPLMFRGLKGKFIYWAFGAFASALVLCIVVSSTVSFLWGGFTLVVVIFGGLALIAQRQKKGLYNKNNQSGIVIMKHLFTK